MWVKLRILLSFQTFGQYAFWAITHALFWHGEAKSVSDLPFPLNWLGWLFGIGSSDQGASRSLSEAEERITPQSLSEVDPSQVAEFVTDPQTQAPRLIMSFLAVSSHMFLREISTIKSHDRGKRGYFVNHKVISYHLQSTRSAQPPGQLSL